MAISEVLEAYRQDHGSYPPVTSGLQALVGDDERSLERVPSDPWGRAYVYERIGDGFRVISYGADGAPGGEGFDADIEIRNGKLVE